jgi:hypothetical protein
MPKAGLEREIAASERSMTVHASDCSAAATDCLHIHLQIPGDEMKKDGMCLAQSMKE